MNSSGGFNRKRCEIAGFRESGSQLLTWIIPRHSNLGEDQNGDWGVVRIKQETGYSPLHGYFWRIPALSCARHSERRAALWDTVHVETIPNPRGFLSI